MMLNYQMDPVSTLYGPVVSLILTGAVEGARKLKKLRVWGLGFGV